MRLLIFMVIAASACGAPQDAVVNSDTERDAQVVDAVAEDIPPWQDAAVVVVDAGAE